MTTYAFTNKETGKTEIVERSCCMVIAKKFYAEKQGMKARQFTGKKVGA